MQGLKLSCFYMSTTESGLKAIYLDVESTKNHKYNVDSSKTRTRHDPCIIQLDNNDPEDNYNICALYLTLFPKDYGTLG